MGIKTSGKTSPTCKTIHCKKFDYLTFSYLLTVKLAAQLMKTTTDEAADLEPK